MNPPDWRDKLVDLEHDADSEAGDSLVADAELTKADVIRSRLLSTSDLANISPPTPLIDGWLYLDSLAMIYGPSGAGKSFAGVDLAMTIGTGQQWWHHHAVTAGRVLYVIAEGASGLGIRTAAWQEHHHSGDLLPTDVTWLPVAVNLFDSAWADALAEVVADLRPSLVVIDTLARSIAGADENSARDIGETIVNLDRIRRAAGSCVLIVHHSGKSLDAGSRGSSALRAAMDTEIELSGDAARIHLKNTKQKNAPEAPSLWLKLLPVLESAVVVDHVHDPQELPAGVASTLDALRQIEVPGGVSASAWRMTVECSEKTFYRHRASLLSHGMIENVGTDKVPRYQVKHDDDA
jgi:archaellum biogenesis ATPase FlaH